MSWLRVFLVFIGVWVAVSAIMWVIQHVYGQWVDGTGLVFIEFIAMLVGAFIAGFYAVENEIIVK